jgi:acetyl-CoA acetyltransferase
MPEAVIVATARSPIGRAVKGPLKDLRPNDLAVRAGLGHGHRAALTGQILVVDGGVTLTGGV